MHHRTIFFLVTIFVIFVLIVPSTQNAVNGRRRRSARLRKNKRVGTQSVKKRNLMRMRMKRGRKKEEDKHVDQTPDGGKVNLQKRSRTTNVERRKNRRTNRRRERKRKIEMEKKDDDLNVNLEQENHNKRLQERRRRRRRQRRLNEEEKRNPLRDIIKQKRVEEEEVKKDDDDTLTEGSGASGGLIVLYVLCGVLAVFTFCCFFMICFSLAFYCCRDVIKNRKDYVKGKRGYMGAREKLAKENALGREQKGKIMNTIKVPDNAEYHQLEDAV